MESSTKYCSAVHNAVKIDVVIHFLLHLVTFTISMYCIQFYIGSKDGHILSVCEISILAFNKS